MDRKPPLIMTRYPNLQLLDHYPFEMSAVQDFERRARSDTAATKGSQLPVPLSPIMSEHSGRHRMGSTFSRASLRFRKPSRSATVMTYHEPEPQDLEWRPGAEPGIDTAADEQELPAHIQELKANCDIKIIDYCPDPDVRPQQIHTTNDHLEQALEKPREDQFTCRWISVNGMSWDVVKILGNKYGLHRLAIEDIIHTHTRTKVDWYTGHACVILTLQKLVRLHEHDGEAIPCDCTDPEHDGEHYDEKHGVHSKRERFRWWQIRQKKRAKRKSHLPYSLDKDDNGKIDEFVAAHTNTSADSPVRQVRTLHRYESAKIPEHTAFMEKHNTLAHEDLAVSVEQVSIFLLEGNTVISFFEQSAEDVENPIRARIDSPETMLRRSSDASLLLQAIIDAIVDLAVPVRDAYNQARKELQVDAMVNPNIATSRALHIFGEEIDMLQNLIKPIVHLVNAIRDHNSEGPGGLGPQQPQQPATVALPVTVSTPDGHSMTLGGDTVYAMNAEAGIPSGGTPGGGRGGVPGGQTGQTKRNREGKPTYNRKISDFRRSPQQLIRKDGATSVTITPLAHTYFGDVLDHCLTMIQALEQMDASATNISTLIFNTVGARTNNFMKILAIVTVLFAPLTFISGYFGQNFDSGHGLPHKFGFFWVVSLPILAVFMLLVFATMLWDNIKDWLSKRGIRAHRNRRNKLRRTRKYL